MSSYEKVADSALLNLVDARHCYIVLSLANGHSYIYERAGSSTNLYFEGEAGQLNEVGQLLG